MEVGSFHQILLLFVCVGVVSAKLGELCEDYISCMEKLEIKQHECLALDRNVRLRSNDACTRKKWDAKLELNGLHMRRAEVARDCVRRSVADAILSETILDENERKQCDAVHDKFQFAPTLAPNASRKKRSSRRKKRDTRRIPTRATECRRAARLWHKQCSALARCCPLTEECKQSTKEIMEQIYEGRRRLRELKDNCFSQK